MNTEGLIILLNYFLIVIKNKTKIMISYILKNQKINLLRHHSIKKVSLETKKYKKGYRCLLCLKIDQNGLLPILLLLSGALRSSLTTCSVIIYIINDYSRLIFVSNQEQFKKVKYN